MCRLVTFFSVLLLTGCAGLQREGFIHEQAGDFIYDVPVEQVWPHVLTLIEEQGFSFREDRSRHLLTTEWREEMSSSSIAASFTRYLVEAVKLDASHTRVRVFRNSMSMSGGPGVVEGRRYAEAARNYANAPASGRLARSATGTRDLRMEWELLQRVSPTDAAELQQVAEARFR